MKNFLIPFSLIAFLFASGCLKEDKSYVETVRLDEEFAMVIGQTVKLEDGTQLMLLGIEEDSRCPLNVECVWAGRVVATFFVQKDDKFFYKTLTDNPANDPALSTTFNAFNHSFKLVSVTPYPEGKPIEDEEYVVKIVVTEEEGGG